MLKARPPTILGSAAFKSMQNEVLKIDQLITETVSELSGWKGPVEAATVSDISLEGSQTIDGVAVTVNEVVLVKNQDDASENGLYVCKVAAWERTDTMAIDSSASGCAIYVTKGTVNSTKVFICSNDIGDDIVGTSDLVFDPFGTSTAGEDTEIQFNDDGVAGANENLTFNSSTNTLKVGSAETAGHITLSNGGGGGLKLEGYNAGGVITIRNSQDAEDITYYVGNIRQNDGYLVVSTGNIGMQRLKFGALGGSVNETFEAGHCSPSSIVLGVWEEQTTPGYVVKIVPGNGTFTVTSSVDIGEGIFSAILFYG